MKCRVTHHLVPVLSSYINISAECISQPWNVLDAQLELTNLHQRSCLYICRMNLT